MKKRIIAAVAVFGLLGGILYFAYAQTAAQNNVKHFTAFFAVEGEAIDQNNDMKKEIARLTGADCEEVWLVGQSKESALNSYIVSGEYPDFISGDTSLYEAGALLPLDEYWENYPNIKNYLTEEQWERFRRPDGHIYWIPQFGVTHGEDVEVTHSGEAFWIQTRVLKWAGYPEIHTVDEYFDLIERYVAANPVMEDGTPNIPFIPFPLPGRHVHFSIQRDEKEKPPRNSIHVIRCWLHLPDKCRIYYRDNTSKDRRYNVSYVHD